MMEHERVIGDAVRGIEWLLERVDASAFECDCGARDGSHSGDCAIGREDMLDEVIANLRGMVVPEGAGGRRRSGTDWIEERERLVGAALGETPVRPEGVEVRRGTRVPGSLLGIVARAGSAPGDGWGVLVRVVRAGRSRSTVGVFASLASAHAWLAGVFAIGEWVWDGRAWATPLGDWGTRKLVAEYVRVFDPEWTAAVAGEERALPDERRSDSC